MSRGESSAARAATPDEREPLSVRLMSRGSLPGALVVAAVAVAYGLLLPYVAEQLSAPAPPRMVDLGGGVTAIAEPTWSTAVATLGRTTLTQSGATLVIGTPLPADRLPAEEIETVGAAWLAQAADGAVATAPRSFETDAGDRAATVVIQEPLQTVQAWVVSDGEREVIAVLTAAPHVWESVSASAQVLVRSVVFAETGP